MFSFNKSHFIKSALLLLFTYHLSPITSSAQDIPPEPLESRAISIPKIAENELPNRLGVVVVERRGVPLVNVSLFVDSGSRDEGAKSAGLANMTAALMTKGTWTRSATQIAEQTEFFGSGINGRATWNSTIIGFDSTTDKLNQVMSVFADVVLRPTFPEKEIALYKSQTLDELKQRLAQPGFMSNAISSRYTFGEHFAFGTPETISSINRAALVNFYRDSFRPESAVIIFTGDISAADAYKLANRFFGAWKNKLKHNETLPGATASPTTEIPATSTLKRMLVVDVPNSGQASVSYNKKVESGRSRFEVNFFPAMVGNSILGGGYSARLNQEIRIKRGLSYGAGSSFSWRYEYANFSTRCQTKNPSAAEVAELTVAEIEKLTGENGTDAEMTARKAVMTGTFGRNFETNFGVSNQIAELLSFELPFGELGTFIANTESVTADNVREFASKNLRGGDIIIVGDYAKFKDDLARRFPTTRIEVIRSTELDLNSVTLRKK